MEFGEQGGPVVVEVVDPPARFAFRWNSPAAAATNLPSITNASATSVQQHERMNNIPRVHSARLRNSVRQWRNA